MLTSMDEEATYPIDAENTAEMARVAKQAQMVTQVSGLFPAQLDLSSIGTILDIGCGPGEWVLAVAQSYPGMQVTGIDISQAMIEYARLTAKERKLSNVHFTVRDVHKGLDFPDASFDMVHARLIGFWQTTTTWPLIIQECFRLCRPGGTICSTEIENLGMTNSVAHGRYNALIMQALRQAGQCFSPFGDYTGITAMQACLLKNAGFYNIQQQASVINASAGMPYHQAGYEDWRTGFKLLQPFLIRQGVATHEEIEALYERSMREMQGDDFCAVLYYQTVWGQKPMQ